MTPTRDELLKELDWALAEGFTGPRSTALLVNLRDLLCAHQAQAEPSQPVSGAVDELPTLPEPWDYCYVWDGLYGKRKFSTAPHNGRSCDHAVPLYTADQMREYAALSRAQQAPSVEILVVNDVGFELKIERREDGKWRFVTDGFGNTPAIKQAPLGSSKGCQLHCRTECMWLGSGPCPHRISQPGTAPVSAQQAPALDQTCPLAAFKNFHRSLCDRFGYSHDEQDWYRDQVSLEEHIAALIKAQQAPEHDDADVWPIVNIDVDDQGRITNAKLYSPGLPAGNHDVYPVRVPYMDEHTEAWHACFTALLEARPDAFQRYGKNGIECAVETIRELAKAAQQAPAVCEKGEIPIAPDRCPITGRKFWGNIYHPELGMVATYGGPFDTYTIPSPDDDGDLRCERFDQDLGDWIEGGEPTGKWLADEQPAAPVSEQTTQEPK